MVRNGEVQKGLFRVDTDPEASKCAISVELSSPDYLPRDAYERHVGGRPPTLGTVGIPMIETAQLNLRAKPDPLPDNPHHWLYWYCPKVPATAVSKIRSRPSLSRAAVSRPWTGHRPGGCAEADCTQLPVAGAQTVFRHCMGIIRTRLQSRRGATAKGCSLNKSPLAERDVQGAGAPMADSCQNP